MEKFMSKELDNQKFDVGDIVKVKNRSDVKGRIIEVLENDIVKIASNNRNPDDDLFFVFPVDELELDIETKLDNQTETLRDKFAGQALQGLLAYSGVPHYSLKDEQTKEQLVAEISYKYAAAMLKAREVK
jgi:hypothetical protein